MSKELVNAIAEMNETEALTLVEKMLDEGRSANDILADCQEAMEIVGKKFEAKEYFLPELILGGEILKAITEVVKPRMGDMADTRKKLGKIVLGTVAGDIHDIGKDIVYFTLDVNGFEVFDLGVDVSPQTFVDKVKEVNPDIVGLSGFLTLAFDTMKETVEAIETAGYRDKVKIMVGGGTVTEVVKDYVGADAFGEDAIAAVSLAKKWMGGN